MNGPAYLKPTVTAMRGASKKRQSKRHKSSPHRRSINVNERENVSTQAKTHTLISLTIDSIFDQQIFKEKNSQALQFTINLNCYIYYKFMYFRDVSKIKCSLYWGTAHFIACTAISRTFPRQGYRSYSALILEAMSSGNRGHSLD